MKEMADQSREWDTDWLSRPSAPAPPRQALRGMAGLLLPAALGAALDWPWWLAAILMLPALALQVRYGWIAARARGLRHTSKSSLLFPMALGACAGLISGPLFDRVGSRYWGLVLVGVAVGADLVNRARWWRRDRR
jgi:hypothetical protein